ncbi:hypothetical protein RUM43_006553 [Polyplax serrata]|uniref:Uncharacterized protein n=1 Tax=Polyplax serrata TaxID=468196 RepID=A0AAN8RVH7_POLSC
MDFADVQKKIIILLLQIYGSSLSYDSKIPTIKSKSALGTRNNEITQESTKESIKGEESMKSDLPYQNLCPRKVVTLIVFEPCCYS